MPVTPTGPEAAPLAGLETMISESATFQAWVGAASATLAKASIHWVEEDEGNLTRPYALIDFADSNVDTISGVGLNNTYTTGGAFFVMFEWDVTAGLDWRDAFITFLNTMGAIGNEMLAQSGTADVPSIKTRSRIKLARDKRKGVDFIQAVYQITY